VNINFVPIIYRLILDLYYST